MKRRNASISQNYKNLFEDWEIAIAVKLVDQFKKQWSVLRQEAFEDLVHECLTHWFFQRDKHDPGRGANPRTFMATVVRNKLRDLIGGRTSVTHRMLSEASRLDEELDQKGEGGLALHETIDPNGLPDPPSDDLAISLQQDDIAKVITKMTGRQKIIYSLLDSGKTKKAVSETLDISRDTVHEEIRRMRKLFEKAGFGKQRK
jgi:RNA polymerase sigma factor (sigma-70 family)